MLHFPTLPPCIQSTLLIQNAYIPSVLTVSFNGIRQTNKQIKQLYQFWHIQFHWFHHFNYFWLKPSIPQFPCPQFNHSNQYCTPFSIFIGTTNSNSFINSIDAINLIVFISSIPTVRSISFNFDSILDITDCYHSYRCGFTQQKSWKIYTTGKHFSQLVVMTVATILTCDSTYLFFFHSVALYPSGSNSSVKSICNSISLIRSIYMVNTIFP